MGRGALTGKYRNQIPPDSRGASATMCGYVEKYLQGRPARITQALATAAAGLDRTLLDVALSWLLGHYAVAGAVVGPRTQLQLKDILNSSLAPLPEQIVTVLDEISGPQAQ